MGIVKVWVTSELILRVLHFPDETELLNAKYEQSGSVTLTLKHPDLPTEDYSKGIPEARPVFRRAMVPATAGEGIPEVTMVDWGIRKR
jgi:hypothetical protein